MEKPNVLVLLASYNGSEYIEDLVNSILSQVEVNVSIIISDDSSSDDSRHILTGLNNNNKNIEIIFHKEQSGGPGKNFIRLYELVDIALYDYIALADQDDIWLDNKLIRSINSMNEYGAIGYSCSVKAFWPNGKSKILQQSSKISKYDFIFEGAGQGCTFVMDKNFFIKVQKFCITNRDVISRFFYHDWLIYLLCRSWGGSWKFDQNYYLEYRQHEANDTGARNSIKAIMSRIKLIKNGWYKNQVITALKLARIANTNLKLQFLESLIVNKNQRFRFVKLSLILAKESRRRISDRIILIIAAIFRYI